MIQIIGFMGREGSKKKKGRQLLICFQENMLFVHIPPLTIQMRGIRLNESVTVS